MIEIGVSSLWEGRGWGADNLEGLETRGMPRGLIPPLEPRGIGGGGNGPNALSPQLYSEDQGHLGVGVGQVSPSMSRW